MSGPRRRRSAVVALVALALGSSSTDAWAKGCQEVSDVVGEKRCSSYGDTWALERLVPVTFRFGFRWADATVAGRTFEEAYKKKHRPKNYTGYSFDGSALGPRMIAAGGADGALTIFVVGQLYVGAEGSLLFGAADTSSILVTSRTGSTTSRYSLDDEKGVDVTFFHLAAPIGYRIALGRASVRPEMAFGGTWINVSHFAHSLDDGKRFDRSSGTRIPLIEPRIAADLWLTQHMSFGAYAGTNLLDTNARSFGFSLTFHNRAFDGDHALW